MVHSRLKDFVEVEQELDVYTVIGYIYAEEKEVLLKHRARTSRPLDQ